MVSRLLLRSSLVFALFLGLVACNPKDVELDAGVAGEDAAQVAADANDSPDAGGPADAAAEPDSGTPDSGVPLTKLTPQFWTQHLTDDLLPYWTMNVAKGSPVGNFPTTRGMDGRVVATDRKPRMIGRQVFTYCIAYMLTGDESLLELARAGTEWLLAHAQDPANGTWYADLDEAGNKKGTGIRTSQDASYAVMGPAAYFFVTGDAKAEKAILATHAALFAPALYWDATNQRVKDALTDDLSAEAYMTTSGSWALVAQLDPINAFMLLVQPVLSDEANRQRFLTDMGVLANVMKDHFWEVSPSDPALGVFWGWTGGFGNWSASNTDFGHMLKTFWMLHLVDKRLADRPFKDFVAKYAPVLLLQAYDRPNGRWASRLSSWTSMQHGSAWWATAEMDQLAATLAIEDPSWIPIVETTAAHFPEDYVDRQTKSVEDSTKLAGEVISGVSRMGVGNFSTNLSDTSKCNQWKNGFHAAEHALVMNLFAHWREGTPAPLYFAFPKADAQRLANLRGPYSFQGRVAAVEDRGSFSGKNVAGDAVEFQKTLVSFDQLH